MKEADSIRLNVLHIAQGALNLWPPFSFSFQKKERDWSRMGRRKRKGEERGRGEEGKRRRRGEYGKSERLNQ